MSTSSDDPNIFVPLPMTTDPATLQDNAIEKLRAAWPDWEPAEGDPEIINIETIGPLAANAAELAAQMPAAALEAFGTKLLGVPFQAGEPARATVTFTVDDNAGGYVIPAGGQLNIDGFAFAVQSDLTTDVGSYTVSGDVVAAENSDLYNSLVGASVSPISLPPFVVSMVVTIPTFGGVNPQDAVSYLNDLSADLRLTIRAIVTLPNFEEAAVAVNGILRAHAETTSARNVTVTVLGIGGVLVSTDLKDELAVIYAGNRLVNVTVAINDPTFTVVAVTWAATIYQGFDPADYKARANAALAAELSPEYWGLPPGGDPGNLISQWYNKTTVSAARLKAVLAGVQGTYEVDHVTINGGAMDADLVLTGAVPLPTPGAMVGTVTFA